MKLKDLKKMLDKLTPEQLKRELLYNSNDHCISGVAKIKRATANLYYTGEDDPAKLFTKKQLKENGYTPEEIQEMEVEIPKGAFVVEI